MYKELIDLKDKIAVITDRNGVLGRAIADGLRLKRLRLPYLEESENRCGMDIPVNAVGGTASIP